MAHPAYRSMINKIFKDYPDETLSLIFIKKTIAEKYPTLNSTSIKRWTKVALDKLESEGKVKRIRSSYKISKPTKKVGKRLATKAAKKSKISVARVAKGSAKIPRFANVNVVEPEQDLSAFKDRVPQSTGVYTGITEIVFAFDTTGSMNGAIAEVKKKVIETSQRIWRDSAKIRIGLVAHGDYCDGNEKAFRMLDFTSKDDVDTLVEWVSRGDLGTSGGDGPENYEMVLEQVARGKFSWTEGSRRVLVMIGDDQPHPPSVAKQQMITYKIDNPREIDWRVEADECYKNGIKVYAVGVNRLNSFHNEVSARTCGTPLEMDGFESMADVVLALCFRETTEGDHYETFMKEVQAEGRMTSNMTRMVRKLSGSIRTPETAAVAD